MDLQSLENGVIGSECSFDAVASLQFGSVGLLCLFGISSSSWRCGFRHAFLNPLAISIYAMRSSPTCFKVPDWSRLFVYLLWFMINNRKIGTDFFCQLRIISACSNNKRRSPSLTAWLLYIFFPIYYCIRRIMFLFSASALLPILRPIRLLAFHFLLIEFCVSTLVFFWECLWNGQSDAFHVICISFSWNMLSGDEVDCFDHFSKSH